MRNRLLTWKTVSSIPGLLVRAALGRFNPERDKYTGADRGDQLTKLPPHFCGADERVPDRMHGRPSTSRA